MMWDRLHINADGDKFWYLNDQRHRTDGPAVEYADGGKSWYLNGNCHRTDGPAIEHTNGDKSWYLNDNRHRTDGPAIEFADGSKYWFLNGQELSLDVWLEANTELSDQQRVMFKLEWS
jgi:hypothetical protein